MHRRDRSGDSVGDGEAGVDVMARLGTPLPEATIESIKKNGVALKAPITTPVGTGFRSINVYLRQSLDLYACMRPCKSNQGRTQQVPEDRLGDRPGEYRGPVRRHRVPKGKAETRS